MSIYMSLGSAPQMNLAAAQWQTNSDLSRLIGENIRQLQSIYKNGFDYINNNPYGLSVTNVVIGVGPADWDKFHTEAVWLKQLINHAKPGLVVDPIGYSTMKVTPSVVGQSVTLNVVFQTPLPYPVNDGYMTFRKDGVVLAKSFVEANKSEAVVTLPVGTHKIEAYYSGYKDFTDILAEVEIEVSGE